MGVYAVPALYAVLLWWSATGLVLVLQHLPRRTHARSMVAASAVLAGALWTIRAVADDDTETGAYLGFTAAVIVWGWQEMSYYMGFISGPKPAACALNLRGFDRFFAALATSLWHEFAILIGGLAVMLITIVVALRVPVIRKLRGHAIPAARGELAALAFTSSQPENIARRS